MSLNTTPRTWVGGEVMTAANLNLEVRDAISGTQGAWTTYAPTWTSSTNPSIGNGTLSGRYRRIGKTVDIVVTMAAGSTTTFGAGAYSFSLPAGLTLVSPARYGSGEVRPSSSSVYAAIPYTASGAIMVRVALNATSPVVTNLSATGVGGTALDTSMYLRFGITVEVL